MRRPRALLAALALSALLAAPEGRCAQGPSGPSAPPRVLVATYSGIISPVSAEFLTQAVARSQSEGYDALVIELDTPGGLDPSMREIIKAILASRVPVLVYVSPSGGRAASAGVFIAMAAHLAAMAPGTNIGAAHPISIGAMGGEKGKEDKVLEGKAVNDAAAYLKSIAHRRGRNEAWAFEAVSKSTSIPSGEAVALGVVDLEAESLERLLSLADGRRVPDIDRPLRTAGAAIERLSMSRRQRWLAALVDPNVAMILMSLGGAGLLIELYNPGLILPGIVGAVSLILAFYSFQTLSASYAGVLLILAGMIFFLLEIKVVSYGLLALSGVAATLLGALMLFQSQPMGGLSVSWTILFSSLAGLLGVTALVSWVVYKSYRRSVTTGPEGMVGAEGLAKGALDPQGKVLLMGELWDAEADGPVPDGARVIVAAVEGLRLKVRRKS